MSFVGCTRGSQGQSLGEGPKTRPQQAAFCSDLYPHIRERFLGHCRRQASAAMLSSLLGGLWSLNHQTFEENPVAMLKRWMSGPVGFPWLVIQFAQLTIGGEMSKERI